MATQGLKGYFEYLQTKTYIDRYPESIVKLDELKGARLLEMGSGVANDIFFLVDAGIISIDDVMFAEPFIPAFCEALDRIEERYGQAYIIEHMKRLSYKALPNPEIPDGCVDFAYANNVLHSLGYLSFEDELDLEAHKRTGDSEDSHVQRILRPPEEKIKEVLQDLQRVLEQGGVCFGRNLANRYDADVLAMLEEKEQKTDTDRFAIWTARAIDEGTLLGIPPEEFASWAEEAGFSNVYVEEEPHSPTRPRINFYFRLER